MRVQKAVPDEPKAKYTKTNGGRERQGGVESGCKLLTTKRAAELQLSRHVPSPPQKHPFTRHTPVVHPDFGLLYPDTLIRIVVSDGVSALLTNRGAFEALSGWIIPVNTTLGKREDGSG